mmetsp:Transcript_17053/g.23997  ORF Transcript_17053/g.23997 Transcript_17053/m.23997 type:complete len:348 (+) Transcript_17053:240-1283(+)
MSNTESPVTQRRTVAALTAEKMDSIGRFDKDHQEKDMSNEEIVFTSGNNATTNSSTVDKKKTTPPPSENGQEVSQLGTNEKEVQPSDVDKNDANDKEDEKNDNSNNKGATIPSESRMEMMEIDQDQDEDLDADMERLGLLGGGDDDDDDDDSDEETGGSALRQRRKKQKQHNCCRPYKVGNTSIVCPMIHRHTGFGVVGVHWFGPIFTMALFLLASHHFIVKAHQDIGPITYWICILWSIFTCGALLLVSLSDPGIVMSTTKLPTNTAESSRWRWCDFCQQYQPPTGAHCPDCNVCIEGYDHHCVWMGTCIGKGNFKAFTFFNISWLLYLIYAILWITIIGPAVTHS